MNEIQRRERARKREIAEGWAATERLEKRQARNRERIMARLFAGAAARNAKREG